MEIDDAANPLIWTAVGYVREQDLQHSVQWQIQTVRVPAPWWKFWLMGVDEPRFSGMVMVETYSLDGTIVKRSPHVYQAQGAAAQSETSELPQ